MKTPFKIRKRAQVDAVCGLFLMSENPADLLALYTRLGSDPLPMTFAVAGGFLLKVPHAPLHALPRVVRLRSLSANLFLPADADLLPALLPDEAAALVRNRGLVFLPGRRVLEYDPAHAVQIADLVRAGPVRRGKWNALPERPQLAERLREIILDRPEETSDGLLEPGGEDIGVEEPLPDDSSIPAKISGRASMGIGKALMGLGKMLGWKGLVALGGKLIKSALDQAPRLSESILGAQEAALRALLREFREGNLEKALRRALPMGGQGDRGGVPGTDATLPTHNVWYSLKNIIGSDEGGRKSYWFGGGDVQVQLAAEYRKAAEAAVARGDYRRAAFIYGKLLNDYRSAAGVLSRGNLHHDAAILYLDKVGDALAAARSFEAAGEFDRALHLYRQRGEHLLAADLLQKTGEQEDAVEEYRKAADQLVRKKGDYIAAGGIMLDKASRLDIALDYFRQGWAGRPGGQAHECLLRLAPLYAEQESRADFLALLGEADIFFEPPGNETGASLFYNKIASLAETHQLAQLRDDLRDRALVGLANKLRQRSKHENKPGPQVGALFGRAQHWAPAMVSDAGFAFDATLKTNKKQPTKKAAPAPTHTHLGAGTIQALCSASETGQVFIGYDNGQVISFDPLHKSIRQFPAVSSAPIALSTNPSGTLVVALRDAAPLSKHCMGYRRNEFGLYELVDEQYTAEDRLTPIADVPETCIGVYSSEEFTVLRCDSFTLISRVISEFRDRLGQACDSLILIEPSETPLPDVEWLCFGQGVMCSYNTYNRQLSETQLGWPVQPPSEAIVPQASMTWFEADGAHCEIARISEDGGGIYWSHLHRHEKHWLHRQSGIASGHSGYNAVAILQPGKLAAARQGRVVFLRCHHHWLMPWSTQDLALSQPLACFFSPLTNELTVITRDNQAVCVPVPNG
jgi:tetratricopeptide (TPR) repeat protein